MKQDKDSTWCPYPWHNLNSNTDGSVKLCCSIVENHHFTDGNKTYNFGKDPIEKIWNSQYINDIRKQFQSNLKPKACDVCWKLEEKNISSSRAAILQQNLYAREEMPAELPTSLELRLGNKCNLKCLTCWSISSSSLAEERKKALAEDQLPSWIKNEWSYETKLAEKENFEWYATNIFEENFNKMAPTLKRLYLTGGEPTLIKENNKFLQKLLDLKNLDCFISFTTNLSVWNEEFYALIEKFNNVEIQISIDGYGLLNDYIRNSSRWETLDKNLDKIKNLNPNIKIKIYSVYSVLNFMWMNELLEFLQAKFTNHRAEWVPIVLQAPDFLSTDLLNDESKKSAIKKIEILESKEIKTELEYKYGISILKKQLATASAPSQEKRQKAIDYIKTTDSIRKNRHPHLQIESLF